jgi:hypothetical protein
VVGITSYYVSQSNGQCESQRSIILVTVNQPPAPSITQAGNVLSATGTFTYYQWYLNGVMIPGANGSSYTTVQAGSYYLVASDINACNGQSNTIMMGLSAGSITTKNGLILYPNPNNGDFTLSGVVKQRNGNASIKILDMSGKVVVEDKLKIENRLVEKRISVGDDIASGGYLLIINTGKQSEAIQFIKK